MTRSPFLRVLDAVPVPPFTMAAIGALALVPPSRSTAVATPVVAEEVDHPLARTSPGDEAGRPTSADRCSLKPVADVATPLVGPALSGGGPAPEPNRSANPLSGRAVGRSRPACRPTDGLRGRATTTSVDHLDRNGAAGPGATAAFGRGASSGAGSPSPARRTR